MESNGTVQEIPEKRKKRKIPNLEGPNFGSANVGANSSAANQPRNRKKIIKLKNSKIEDLFVIRNFLPICEEFLVKHYENIFSNLLRKEDEEENKTNGEGNSLHAITKGEVEQDESEVDGKAVQLKQSGDHNGGGIKQEECVRRKMKRKKRSKSVDHLETGSESVDDLGDIPTVDSEEWSSTDGSAPNRSHSNHARSNLYRKYVRHTKQCLREMDLPFDRAVLLNIVDKKDNTSKIMKIVNKKKVISAFGDTWEFMIEHILSLKEHKNLMKIYDIYDDDKNFYMIMEKLHGKELFNFLVYKKQVKESVCKYIISQILQAVNYLHYHNIIHRDIKPENLMFRNKKRKDKTYEYNYELVLIDFDTCQFVYPPRLGGFPRFYYSPGSTNLRRSASPSSSTTNGIQTDCSKLCKHRDVKKMEQKKGTSTGEIRKRCSKRFCEKSTNGRSTHERSTHERSTHERNGTPNLCHHSGRKEPRTKSSSGKKHMKLVGTYGYIAPEIIKGHNYSILSDMWSIGIIFYILMTGITPLPMCLMVNYKNTKDIILKKEKKGINFSLLSFNSYPLARDLCEKLLQFNPAERMPNSVIASHHPWLRYFNMIGRNVHLCASGREYLSPSQLSQNLLHGVPYVKNKRPRYEDRNCHVILPYHIHEQVYQKKNLPPFLSPSNEQKYYYLINQGVRNYYEVGNDILPHPGLSTSLERFPYLRGGNLRDDTPPAYNEKVIDMAYSVENDVEGKTQPVNYYQDGDSKHPPRISHQFARRHNDGEGEGMAPLRHAQKMTRGDCDDEDNHMEGDEKAESAQRRRPFRRKTGNILTNLKGKVNGATLPQSENANHGGAHPYIPTQQDLCSSDNHPLGGSFDPISVRPDGNNFVDLFEHLVEKKKRKFTMRGKPLDNLPPIENPFPMYYIPNEEPMNRTSEEVDRFPKRKEHTTSMEQKNVEYIRTKNMSEIFSSPPMCIIPQNDPMKMTHIDHGYKRAYDFPPRRHVHLPNGHLAPSHKGGKPNVILLPQPLPPSLLPLVYHHSNEGRNNTLLNDKAHLTNSSEDIVGVISSDRQSNTSYANVVANAYDPCQVTNLYEISNSLNEPQEGHKNGIHSQHDELNTNLAGITTRSKIPQKGTSRKIPQNDTKSKIIQNGTSSKITQNGTRSMFQQNRNMPPIYVNYRRAYKNNIEMVPSMFREN